MTRPVRRRERKSALDRERERVTRFVFAALGGGDRVNVHESFAWGDETLRVRTAHVMADGRLHVHLESGESFCISVEAA